MYNKITNVNANVDLFLKKIAHFKITFLLLIKDYKMNERI